MDEQSLIVLTIAAPPPYPLLNLYPVYSSRITTTPVFHKLRPLFSVYLFHSFYSLVLFFHKLLMPFIFSYCLSLSLSLSLPPPVFSKTYFSLFWYNHTSHSFPILATVSDDKEVFSLVLAIIFYFHVRDSVALASCINSHLTSWLFFILQLLSTSFLLFILFFSLFL